MIHLKITLELTLILLNISRRVVGNILINISPSNIFSTMFLLARLHQKCQAALGRCGHQRVKP